MTSERVGLLLAKLPELQGLNRQVRRLLALQCDLAETLPDNLAAATTAITTVAGELLLIADSGAVAAKLRHLAPRILVFFRQRGHEVTGIRIQVQVSIRHNPLPRKQIFLSTEAEKAIAALSGRLKASPLKAALERLSRQKKSDSNSD